MSRATRYPTEVRERAVRMVFEHEREYAPQAAPPFVGGGPARPGRGVPPFIDARREEFGVEPICAQLPIAPSTYYAALSRPPSARALSAVALITEIKRIFDSNY